MTKTTFSDVSGDQAVEEPSGGPKYKQIYKLLRQSISENVYQAGSKLPSESELVDRFDASRPTVGRALAQLESDGFVHRRAGSGTFVVHRTNEKNMVFGLLIPELGLTEIFEPICQGISQARAGSEHELIWGPLFQRGAADEIQAERLCEYYLKRGLSGVFFAPLEISQGKDEVNRRIVRSFDVAGVPIILLDRDICEHPKRSRYDLVGIDNSRAGRVITDHLINQGARKIVFFSRPDSAPTVKRRIMGYREALREDGYEGGEPSIFYGDPADLPTVRRLLTQSPDALVCANDYTAAQVITTLDELGVQVPAEIKVTGMDDVKYASLLKVPLTTIHQPCAEIGFAALMAMHDRVAHPDMAARDFLIDFRLIVRSSCGARSGEV